MNDQAEQKVIYQCREVQLIQDESGAYYVRAGSAAECMRLRTKNPLEAWTCFIDTLDCLVRRRIGNMLEHEGKNRYTGATPAIKSTESRKKIPEILEGQTSLLGSG